MTVDLEQVPEPAGGSGEVLIVGALGEHLQGSRGQVLLQRLVFHLVVCLWVSWALPPGNAVCVRLFFTFTELRRSDAGLRPTAASMFLVVAVFCQPSAEVEVSIAGKFLPVPLRHQGMASCSGVDGIVQASMPRYPAGTLARILPQDHRPSGHGLSGELLELGDAGEVLLVGVVHHRWQAGSCRFPEFKVQAQRPVGQGTQTAVQQLIGGAGIDDRAGKYSRRPAESCRPR